MGSGKQIEIAHMRKKSETKELNPALSMVLRTGARLCEPQQRSLSKALRFMGRETLFPRLDDLAAIGWRCFSSSIRELGRGILPPFCFADSPKYGAGEALPAGRDGNAFVFKAQMFLEPPNCPGSVAMQRRECRAQRASVSFWESSEPF
jgi:hypothetical protein